MHIRHAKPGMLLAKDLTDPSGSLLLEKGIALTESYLQRLKQMGITTIYIDDSADIPVRPTPLVSSSIRSELTSCLHALVTMKHWSTSPSPEQSVYLNQLSATTTEAIHEIESNMPQILNCQIRKPSTDETTHAVNVSLLSIITGLYLRMPRSAIHDLAVGALLHDIGKLIVPAHNNDSLPDSQHALHALQGSELLLNCKFRSAVAAIVAQHHEYFNGTGIPHGLKGCEIHPLSRLVTIADHFDNAINQAAHDYIPRAEVVEQMMASGNVKFDLNMLNAFFRVIAIYPVGSMVELNTGQTGYVIQNQSISPSRPHVRVFSKSSYIDINLAYKPTITIVDSIHESSSLT